MGPRARGGRKQRDPTAPGDIMRLLIVLSIACLALAGCQSAPRPGAGAAPVAIASFTNQKTVYECPSCKMDYDHAGNCPMCGVALVAMKVDYICPADDKPVDRAGKCPRCEANVRVVKTAMSPAAEATPTGN